jgi:CubicO group peptidase (beta-lactamase class C family)
MMKRFCAALVFLFLLQSCHVGRFFIYNFADIRDHRIFPNKEIKKSEIPFRFIESPSPNNLKLPKTVTRRFKVVNFEEALKKSGTMTLIVIRNDSIIYQWERKGYTNSKVIPSFSLAKSFVSVLTGIAVDEGYIKSIDDPITNYLDYLDKEKFGKITIQHLLDMQSGIKFNENYFNPFSDIAKYYYGTHLKKYLSHLDVEYEAGKKFRYISINTQILGLILEKATGKSLTEYLQEKLWTPLGMEYEASWSIDSKKHNTEKAFCCINGRAKDYAKLGRLMLNKGNWNGKQIVSKKYIEATTTFSKSKNGFIYSNLFWHTRDYYPVSDSNKIARPYGVHVSAKDSSKLHLYKASGEYYAQGLLGQYVYVAPKKNMIFIRMGKREGGIIWSYLFKSIAEKN